MRFVQSTLSFLLVHILQTLVFPPWEPDAVRYPVANENTYNLMADLYRAGFRSVVRVLSILLVLCTVVYLIGSAEPVQDAAYTYTRIALVKVRPLLSSVVTA